MKIPAVVKEITFLFILIRRALRVLVTVAFKLFVFYHNVCANDYVAKILNFIQVNCGEKSLKENARGFEICDFML